MYVCMYDDDVESRVPATTTLVLGASGWMLNGTEPPGLLGRHCRGVKTEGVARTRLNPPHAGSLIEGVSRHAPLPFGLSPGIRSQR